MQYMVWWKPDGKKRLEFGPLYNKKVAKRDAFHYQTLYGEANAGWEVYDPNRDRPRRDYRSRRYD